MTHWACHSSNLATYTYHRVRQSSFGSRWTLTSYLQVEATACNASERAKLKSSSDSAGQVHQQEYPVSTPLPARDMGRCTKTYERHKIQGRGIGTSEGIPVSWIDGESFSGIFLEDSFPPELCKSLRLGYDEVCDVRPAEAELLQTANAFSIGGLCGWCRSQILCHWYNLSLASGTEPEMHYIYLSAFSIPCPSLWLLELVQLHRCSATAAIVFA